MLHVYKDVYPPVRGGIEGHIDGLRRNVPGWHSDVLVAARRRRTTVVEVAGGIEVRCAELGRPLGTPLAPGFARWIGRMRPDLIHLHAPHPTGEIAALAARRSCPIVVSYHADVVRQRAALGVYSHVLSRVLGRAAAIVIGTRRIGETSPHLGAHAAKLRVIPYAVDAERFDPRAADPARVAVLRDRFPGPVVLAVGRLVYYKGFEQLADVARAVDADILIAGAGPMEAPLRTLAAGIPRMHVLGAPDDAGLVALHAIADVFVLPSTSRAESFGISTLEAQAMGVPAVVTDTGSGTIEAVAPGVTGVVVPVNDPGALTEAVAGLLADPVRRSAMGAAARRRALERSPAASGRAHAALYAQTAR